MSLPGIDIHPVLHPFLSGDAFRRSAVHRQVDPPRHVRRHHQRHLVGAPAPQQKRSPQAKLASPVLVCLRGHGYPRWTGGIRPGLLHDHPFRRMARLFCRFHRCAAWQPPRLADAPLLQVTLKCFFYIYTIANYFFWNFLPFRM